MRHARAGPPVPVVLVADQGALFIPRFDDEHAVRTEDDERNDIGADIARRVARQHDVVGGQTLTEIRGSALGEAGPCAVTGERGERRAESPHFVLSVPRRAMLVAAGGSHK